MTHNKNDAQKLEMPEVLEDIPDRLISISDSLSDAELIEGGMTPVRGWMRTRSSKNAERVKKAKARREQGADGRAPRKQLNIEAPVDPEARDALKRIAALMLDGDILASDLDAIISNGLAVQQIYEKGGLKASILRRLLKST